MTDPADLNLDDLRRRARRRLIGAIVLALAAAVVVPMLLESEPRPLGEDVTVRIPQVDDGRFVNRLQDKDKSPARSESGKAEPVPADASRSGSSGGGSSGKSAAAAGAPDTVPTAATRAAEPPRRSVADAEQKVLSTPASAKTPVPAKNAPAETAKAPPPVPAPAKAGPGAVARSAPAAASSAPAGAAAAAKPDPGPTFSVQLAAFSDDKGANALANKLKRAGHSAYTEPLETSKGTLWRVRVGPFPTRDDAVAARETLKGEGQVGIVAPSR